MPRIKVIADDGWVAHDERVGAPDFDSDLFRRHLAERLGWAVEEAEARAALREDAGASIAGPAEVPVAA